MPQDENEYTKVELPFVEQLKTMGWKHLQGDTEVPSFTERSDFGETLLVDRLKMSLKKLNPWMTDQHMHDAVYAATHLDGTKLMERNQAAMQLLVKGLSVDVNPAQHDGLKSKTVRFIDFGPDAATGNDFLAINQYRADILGNRSFCVPDLVLFVNGIPLVVVEAKSPAASNPMESAITDLLKYSNQRDSDEEEGVERLFNFNLFLVATTFYEARSATIGARPKHYMEWKDTSPVPTADFAEQLGVDQLSSQQTLVAGMLHPDRILDLLRNFVLFTDEGGRTIKIIARYQQYRAVHEALHRLQTKPTKIQDGTEDRRGGIIWHTQGSGKSLTMVFLVRKMRTIEALRSFKIIVLTDRRSLHRQLSETAQLTDEPLTIPAKMADVPSVLRREGKDLVFTLIQRMRSVAATVDASESEEDDDDEAITGALDISEADLAEVEVLNKSEKILLLVDEAHRSHGNTTHAMMMEALPNCAKIGFTGTPIMADDKVHTEKIFGTFIGPPYTIKQSQEDGATRPIRYEGWSAESDIEDDKTIDEIFDEAFSELSDEERERVKAKYVTKHEVRNANKLIDEHARHILRDYIGNVMPDGFKAQLVASSRRGAMRYQKALDANLGEIIDAIDDLPQSAKNATDDEIEKLSEDQQFLIRASRHKDLLERLDFAAVISGSKKDPSDWSAWTTQSAQDKNVARFKKALKHKDPEKQDGLAIVCVKSMLLTGFDAPINQTLYVDRFLQGHDLLQAIARVNRNYESKRVGRVVDFYGVAWHLGEALRVYSVDDRNEIKGGLTTIQDDLNKLEQRHKKTLQVFVDHGITDIFQTDDCVHMLSDEKIRAKFIEELTGFLSVLNSLRFRPESRQYLRDARHLGFINKSAANLFRDNSLDINISDCGDQVRELIDAYVMSRGINPEIEPVDILHADFEKEVEKQGSDRSKAAAMEHAAKSHISKKMDEDPVLYQEFSARIRQILEEFVENWVEQKEAFITLIEDLRAAANQTIGGLSPHTQVPFFRTIIKHAGRKTKTLSNSELANFTALTVEVVDHVRQEIRAANFWAQAGRPEKLGAWISTQIRTWVRKHPEEKDNLTREVIAKLADDLLAQARSNHSALI